MKQYLFLFVLISGLLTCCKTQQTIVKSKTDDGIITFKFVQVNDVYEIAPLSGGKYGGMARVAHVVDSLKQINKNTFLFMAGDFLNPSLLGTLKVGGERVAGKQMIDVMNAMNFDLVTYGNHEFDLSEDQFQKRLDESQFQWISSNTFQKKGEEAIPFKSNGKDVAYTYTLNIQDSDGTNINVGFFSVTIDSNPVDYVFYGDAITYGQDAFSSLKGNTDLVIGLTHLALEEDIALANTLPEVPLLMGGHEHTSMLVPTKYGVVAKADANAKTVYIHTLEYNSITKQVSIDSDLFPIDETIAANPTVKVVVDRWEAILKNEILQVIDNPSEIIYRGAAPLDGTDSAGRSIQTDLGDIITAGMADAFNDKEIDGAIVNGGSFRLDDMLPKEITSLDIFRVLPFGGQVYKVKMKGSLLTEVLNYGKTHRGTGAYLQRHQLQESDIAGWLVNGQPIYKDQIYTIAMSDFLLKGFDIPFLTPENEGIVEVYKPIASEPASDIRKAVILFLKSKDK
ncbi:bifunctional metallophosphatase/5'-nucleotidase [Cochleicola gelatinilyticus]|uniref:bifunctional metallophosphatase/5'-nucleotidase n=1 Tax=Cochleicola gelatinilyticus TaxID=1763537 RepID=UPI0009ED8425|nr:bifunctional metallophosphatase/5'-nucleotidase [Cochleicola gelatinilyticus]